MLCLFETPAGFALFKVLDQSKLSDLPSLWQEFESPAKASKVVKLKAFTKFDNTADALAAAANLVRLGRRACAHMFMCSRRCSFCSCMARLCGMVASLRWQSCTPVAFCAGG